MTDIMKTVELGSVTLTCTLEIETREKTCEIVHNDGKKGVRLMEADLHNIRSTAEEVWAKLEKEVDNNE